MTQAIVRESGSFRTTQKSKKSDFWEKSDFSFNGTDISVLLHYSRCHMTWHRN